MNERREQLHEIFCGILKLRNVYFQPPESIKMSYPAIVYELSDIRSSFANDGVYLAQREYSVTLIDKDPDNLFVKELNALPTCRFNRHYKEDNLNHYVFTIFY